MNVTRFTSKKGQKFSSKPAVAILMFWSERCQSVLDHTVLACCAVQNLRCVLRSAARRTPRGSIREHRLESGTHGHVDVFRGTPGLATRYEFCGYPRQEQYH